MAPNLAEAHLDYGLALAKLSKADEALSEFKIALNLKPDLDSAWLTMGALYQSCGRLADAIVAYRQFLARFPNNIDAPKIASLVQGLQKELDLSRPTGGVNAPDDYYAQITRLGVTRWPAARMPIKIYVADGAGVPGFTQGFDKLVRQAFTDWAKVSNGLIKCQFVEQPKDADIECYWLADPQKLANAAEDGETRFSLNHEGMVHATMQLLTVPSMPEMPLTENRFRQITLHEVGHALGLNGHTADPRDAMYFSSTLEDKWRDLSQRDKNTIARLYGQSGV
jgi:predicted Zn-dependent protease